MTDAPAPGFNFQNYDPDPIDLHSSSGSYDEPDDLPPLERSVDSDGDVPMHVVHADNEATSIEVDNPTDTGLWQMFLDGVIDPATLVAELTRINARPNVIVEDSTTRELRQLYVRGCIDHTMFVTELARRNVQLTPLQQGVDVTLRETLLQLDHYTN